MTSPVGIDTATRAVEDAFYVSVGAGVLAVQSAQVRRRELQARVAEHVDEAQQAFTRLRSGADDGLRVVEHQVDEVLDQVADHLPDGARDLLTRGTSAVFSRLRAPASSALD